jgi:3-carboxy-cis,cis-muconate cycloisomerase
VIALGQLAVTIEKIAHNINLLSSSDIGELYETPTRGKGASSSMAHKRNQRCSEFAEALGCLARGRSMQINETSKHEHERSGGVWISEWVIIPEVFLLTSGALKWTKKLFNTLKVDEARMLENLRLANEQINHRQLHLRTSKDTVRIH